MHPAFTKMSHFLCACLPVLFPSQHSQQDHTSRRGYGDPDQRERIPCLGHSRRRCGRTGRRAPRAAGALRGTGDTFVPSLLNLGSIWVIRLGLAVLLITPLGLRGMWIAMAIELCIRGLLLLYRQHTSKYYKIS